MECSERRQACVGEKWPTGAGSQQASSLHATHRTHARTSQTSAQQARIRATELEVHGVARSIIHPSSPRIGYIHGACDGAQSGGLLWQVPIQPRDPRPAGTCPCMSASAKVRVRAPYADYCGAGRPHTTSRLRIYVGLAAPYPLLRSTPHARARHRTVEHHVVESRCVARVDDESRRRLNRCFLRVGECVNGYIRGSPGFLRGGKHDLVVVKG